MAKKLIYTVITGDYDEVQPCPNFPEWDYLLITDNANINANGWPIKVIEPKENSVKLQRYWKINSHLLDYDLTVYIDGNMTLKADPKAIVSKYFKGGMLLVVHPTRKCIIPESSAIVSLKKDDFNTVRKQIGEYIGKGMPFDFGLYASGFIIRDKSLQGFEIEWESQVSNHSHRDQLSLPYVLWKMGIKPDVIPWTTLTHYVTINKHKVKPPIQIWYSNPYSISKNFGKAINDFCEIVPNDSDWIVIQDGDICYLTPEWGKIIHDSLQKNGDKFGLVGCYTNCLNGLHQLHENKRVTDLVMLEHHEIAKTYTSTDIEEISLGVAGLFMAFKKSTWKKVGGFVENNVAFDTLFNQAIRRHCFKVGLMKGLYIYHLYRIWDNGNPNSTGHLK